MSNNIKLILLMAVTFVALAGCRESEPDVLTVDWHKTYAGRGGAAGRDALPAGDGGLFVVGMTSIQYQPERRAELYLLRIDAAGEVVWEKTYGRGAYYYGQAITTTGDGALLLAGRVSSPDTEGIDVCLFKVDREGEEIWSKILRGPKDEMVKKIRPTNDGGFILFCNRVDPDHPVADSGEAGNAGFDARSNVCLIKIDEGGNEIWSRVCDSEKNILVGSGLHTPDGGFLVVATITGFPEWDDDVYLVKFDKNGSTVWEKTWTQGRANGYGLVRCADGNYLVSGAYIAPGETESSKTDFLFLKVDPDGNVIWDSIFGDPRQADKSSVLAVTDDGGFIAAGERTPDWYTREADISVLKIDGDGKLVWRQDWDALHTMYAALFQQEDGGYLIVGMSFVDGQSRIVAIKTLAEGAPPRL